LLGRSHRAIAKRRGGGEDPTAGGADYRRQTGCAAWLNADLQRATQEAQLAQYARRIIKQEDGSQRTTYAVPSGMRWNRSCKRRQMLVQEGRTEGAEDESFQVDRDNAGSRRRPVAAALTARGERTEPAPKELQDIGVEEHLNVRLPLELAFVDSNGKTVRLA